MSTLLGRKDLGRAAPYVHLAVITSCAAVTAVTLVRAEVFFSTPWPRTLWQQALILFAVIAALTSGVAMTARIFRLRIELPIAALAVAMFTVFCGLAATGVVLYFLVSAICLARALLHRFRKLDELHLSLQLVAGWAAYGIFFTVFARARMHTPAVHALLLAVPITIVVAVPALRRALWQRLRSGLSHSEHDRPRDLLYVVGLVTCVVIMSFHLAEVALPERYFDALVMHLHVPSYVMGHRRWGFDVKNYVFAYMPMTIDFLYAHMFLLQGEQAARLLNFVAFLLTCLAIFQIAARCTSRNAAVWSVALFASIPIALIESTSLFIEHSVALFIVSAALAIVATGFRVSLLGHALVMILLAAATASKLHGAVGALLLGGASAFLYLRSRPKLAELVRFMLVTVCAAVAALWPYILAWRKTSNPVFPFMNAVFKSPYWRAANFSDDRWVGNLSPWMLFDATFHTNRFAECTDGAVGFTLFVFLPAGILAAIYRRDKIALFSLAMGLAAIVVVAQTSQYLRYFFIFAPLLMVGVALAIDAIGAGRSRVLAFVGAFAVAVLNVTQFPTAGWVVGTSDLRAIFDSDVRRALVLDHAPERIANEVINHIAGPSARVMYFANPFGALLTGTAVYDNWYNTTHETDFAGIVSETDVASLMQQIKPSYVIFDPYRLQDPTLAKRYTAIADYLSHDATVVTHVGRLTLYRTEFAAQ